MNDPLEPLRRMYNHLKSQTENPVYRKEIAIHIMSPIQLEAIENKDTPPHIKHLILLSTYVGTGYEEEI